MSITTLSPQVIQRNFQPLLSATNYTEANIQAKSTSFDPEECMRLREPTALEKIVLSNDGDVLKALKWAFTAMYEWGKDAAIAFFSGEGQGLKNDSRHMGSISFSDAKNIADVIKTFGYGLNVMKLSSVLDNLRQGNKEAKVRIMGDDDASIDIQYGAVVLSKKNQPDVQLMAPEEFLSTLTDSVEYQKDLTRAWTNLNSLKRANGMPATGNDFIKKLVVEFKKEAEKAKQTVLALNTGRVVAAASVTSERNVATSDNKPQSVEKKEHPTPRFKIEDSDEEESAESSQEPTFFSRLFSSAEQTGSAQNWQNGIS